MLPRRLTLVLLTQIYLAFANSIEPIQLASKSTKKSTIARQYKSAIKKIKQPEPKVDTDIESESDL